VESATALLTHLNDLIVSMGEDPDDTNQCLTDAVVDFSAAVGSYCGMQLTMTQHDVPVVLTAVTADTNSALPVRASLRLPLALLGPDHEFGSKIVLFAGTPGAFVDLAADLDYTLSVALGSTRRPLVVLDADLPDGTIRSGLSGVDELASINRAIGTMIATGHHPDEAATTLHRQAAANGCTPNQWAQQLLHRR